MSNAPPANSSRGNPIESAATSEVLDSFRRAVPNRTLYQSTPLCQPASFTTTPAPAPGGRIDVQASSATRHPEATVGPALPLPE